MFLPRYFYFVISFIFLSLSLDSFFHPLCRFPSPIQSTRSLFIFVSVHSICSRFKFFFFRFYFSPLLLLSIIFYVQLFSFFFCKQKLIAGEFHSIFNFLLPFLFAYSLISCSSGGDDGSGKNRLSEDLQKLTLFKMFNKIDFPNTHTYTFHNMLHRITKCLLAFYELHE